MSGPASSPRNRRWIWGPILCGLVLAISAVVLIGTWGCHGHIMRQPLVPNHTGDFDFSDPPCPPNQQPQVQDGDLVLRYLGVSGLYIRWRNVELLTAPFFTNYGVLKAGLGKVDWDEAAIDQGLAGLELRHVQAVLLSHSHYDHIGDLPPILLDHAVSARLYSNRSAVRMLSAFDALDGRLEDLNDRVGQWIRPRDAAGVPLPVRFMALESSHAPHMRGYHYGKGEVKKPWTTWEGKRLRAMKEGRTLAFLIDLLSGDDDDVAFRLYYMDAASGTGAPPPELIEQHPVDLAVLCMPSSWLVDGYPEDLLARTRAAHALFAHYEDFFRPRTRPLRFVALLTDRRAAAFATRVNTEMARESHRLSGPSNMICGPSGPAWTMPLPGEWLRFPTDAQQNPVDR